MRFFGGMSNQDISGALGVSARTITDDAAAAIAWLRAELAGRELPPLHQSAGNSFWGKNGQSDGALVDAA
ncbi:MAG: hypothetical protein H6816_16010 [Phycisphaerales bacterium]|nr:hypothetical protein [Phycisphaerales bacterium]